MHKQILMIAVITLATIKLFNVIAPTQAMTTLGVNF